MPRRSIWSVRQRAALFDLPTDEAALPRHYMLSGLEVVAFSAQIWTPGALCYTRISCMATTS